MRNLIARERLLPGDMVVEFYGARNTGIEEMIKVSGVGDFVRVMGHVSRDRAMDAQKGADALLLLESGAEDALGVLPGKLFEYIGSGTPIISIGSRNGSAIDRVLRHCQFGICLADDVGKIELTLQSLLASEVFDWYRPVPDHILEYSRERLASLMYERHFGKWATAL
jgi:glycosyltransferase involved in cell wall biosynthesis